MTYLVVRHDHLYLSPHGSWTPKLSEAWSFPTRSAAADLAEAHSAAVTTLETQRNRKRWAGPGHFERTPGV